MKPARFEYVKAVSVADAVSVLAEYGGDARVLAGGQSLVPLLGMRLLRPAMVVDVNGLRDEIGGVEVRGEELLVGALVRYSEIETSDVIAEHAPLLRHVVTFIGDRQVRNRGTLGGAVAQADPTGEMALASLTLGARVHARGPEGAREIPIEEFFLGSYATALAPEEMVTGIAFPLAPTRFRFFERGRKHNDFALLSMAVVARPGSGGAWEGVRIGLGGANDRPVLALAAARELEARAWDPDLIARASRRALEAADPPDDVRGTAEYRSHLLPIHLRRLLTDLAGEPSRG